MIHALTPYISYLPARLARNPIVLNVDAASAQAYPDRSGLRYYCKVMVPESYLSNTYRQLVRLEAAEQPPQKVGAGVLLQGAFFEIQNQIRALLTRTPPEFDQARISVADGLVMPYYCVVSIENNDVEISAQTLPSEQAVLAGIDPVDYAAYKSEFFTTYIGGQNRFLTWAKNGKTVFPDQPEFLYFLTNFRATPQKLRLYCEAVYVDNGQESRETFMAFELANITGYTAYCCPVGPKALGLDQKPGTVAGYSVWLTNETDQRVSEVREYRLNQEYVRNVRFVLFSNSLGGYDTLALVGDGEEQLKVNRQISQRYNGWEYLPSYAETVIQEVQGKRQLTVNTGWMHRYQAKYLEELILSEDLYLATDRAFVPIIPAIDQYTSHNDEEDLIGRQLTFDYANPKSSFSNLPSPGTLTQRPTGYRPKSFACLLDGSGKRTGKRQATVLEKYYLDNNAPVVGAALKPNLPGSVGYIPPITSMDCQTPAFLNQLISRAGSYKRTTCPAGQQGGPATIVVQAGLFGSEISQADADAKAEIEFARINTQAYADLSGTCVLEPEKYAWNVGAGNWHYRAADPASLAVHWLIVGDPRPQAGNVWMAQNSGSAWSYPLNSNDLEFPLALSTGPNWRLMIFGLAGTQRRVKVYQNGTLRLNYVVTMNVDGFEYVSLTERDGVSFSLAALDKLYLSNEPA